MKTKGDIIDNLDAYIAKLQSENKVLKQRIAVLERAMGYIKIGLKESINVYLTDTAIDDIFSNKIKQAQKELEG